MRGTTKVFVLSAMLVAMLGPGSSRAETTEWRGSVKLSAPPAPNPDTVRYVAEDCHGDHTDAVFHAFIDVSAYEGRTLRFTPLGAPAVWLLQRNPFCRTSPSGPATSTSTTVEWVSSGINLSIALVFGDTAGGTPPQASVEGFQYVVQVCPCSS